MNKLHVATPEDLKAIQAGFKLYRKDGKFTYVRKDYIDRSIAAGQVFFDHDVIAFIQTMKRGGRVGNYKYTKGEWNIHQILSVNKKNTLGPYKFLKQFVAEYCPQGRIFGCVHDTNKESLAFHKGFGFKEVGQVSWSGATVNGIILAYDSVDSEKFLSETE